MNTIDKITSWGDSHHVGWLDIFRIALGTFLFSKGIEFGRDPHEISELVTGGKFSLFSFFLLHSIPIIHLAGGFMIAIGLQARWAIIFQLPILLGAVVLNLVTTSSFGIYSNLGVSIVTSILLIIFLIYGSGPYSVDAFFKKNEEQ